MADFTVAWVYRGILVGAAPIGVPSHKARKGVRTRETEDLEYQEITEIDRHLQDDPKMLLDFWGRKFGREE